MAMESDGSIKERSNFTLKPWWREQWLMCCNRMSCRGTWQNTGYMNVKRPKVETMMTIYYYYFFFFFFFFYYYYYYYYHYHYHYYSGMWSQCLSPMTPLAHPYFSSCFMFRTRLGVGKLCILPFRVVISKQHRCPEDLGKCGNILVGQLGNLWYFIILHIGRQYRHVVHIARYPVWTDHCSLRVSLVLVQFWFGVKVEKVWDALATRL